MLNIEYVQLGLFHAECNLKKKKESCYHLLLSNIVELENMFYSYLTYTVTSRISEMNFEIVHYYIR
jgi:hypothetical protein